MGIDRLKKFMMHALIKGAVIIYDGAPKRKGLGTQNFV
jgi:hypothetical protein